MTPEEKALLGKTALFCGIEDAAMEELFACLDPVCRSYGTGEILLAAGSTATSVGVVLEGSIEAFRPGAEGIRIPIAHMGPGGVFADVLGGSSLTSPVTVTAQTPCRVVYFPYRGILGQTGKTCAAHERLLQNLVRSISDKYFSLSHRVELLVMKSLRARISAYLLAEAARQSGEMFAIPHSRSRLAEYLNCDRSALSRELSRMQAEGLLETYKSSFKLKDMAALRAACHE